MMVKVNPRAPLFTDFAGTFQEARPKGNFPEILRASLQNQNEQGSSASQSVQEYVVKPGDTLWKIGMELFREDPYKIARENGIANPDLIYPGQKLRIQKEVIPPQVVTASWYGKEYHNKPTASGETFDMYKNTLAHKTLPLGTVVKLINPENGQMAVGRINDRGPFIAGRDVDLSYGLAEKLGFVKKGVGKLVMVLL
jgi:rare lipoprotein A